MHADARRIAIICTVAAALLIGLLWVMLWLMRLSGNVLAGNAPQAALTAISLPQLYLWGLVNAVYGLYFLLLVPPMWLLFRALHSQQPVAATGGFVIGVLGVLMESVARFWHLIVEVPIARAYQTSPVVETQATLSDLLGSYSGIHTALHYGSYITVVWAVIALAVLLQHRVAPWWLGFTAFGLVLALGPFPPLGLVWAVPAVFALNGEGGKAPARSGSRRTASRALTPARGRR
jgi:hypothetical protein